MEDEELNNSNYSNNSLNRLICKECGSSLILESYNIIESKKVKAQFICRNPDHKIINVFNIDDFKKLINNNLKKSCKCMFCQKISENDKTINYCYDCQKTICLNCKGNHSHKNGSKDEYIQKKCLIHNYNITHYCKFCKKDLCKKCVEDDFDHIREIESSQKNIITEIKNKQEDFNFSSLKNEINDISNMLKNDKNKQIINIIYHDEKLNKSERYKGIVSDSYYFEDNINGSFILTNDSTNLQLVLDIIQKYKSKSKFFLIINGGSSRNIITDKFKQNYNTIFLGAIIYTIEKKNYEIFQKNNSDLIKGVEESKKDIIKSINNIVEKGNITNDKFFINKLMSEKLFKEGLSKLKEELINFYGDESENSFNNNFKKIKEFIKKENFQMK